MATGEPISASALRTARKTEREYESKRSTALAVGKAYRAGEVSVIRLEDAMNAAIDARYWAWTFTRRREQAEKRPVVPHGGRVSPGALERLRRRGLLKT